MTVKEMHNLVDLRWQKIASKPNFKFESDELDSILNQAQHSFIKERYTKMFVNPNSRVPQVEQRRTDDLRAITVPNYTVKCMYPSKGSGIGYLNEPDAVVAPLPKDYMYLVSDRSSVKHIDNANCLTINKPEVCNDPLLQEYICVLPFVAPIQDICQNGVVNLQIVLNNVLKDNGYATTTVFDYNWFSKLKGYIPYSGLREESDKYLLVNLVLEFLNRFNSLRELVNFSIGQYTNSVLPTIEYNNKQSVFDVYWEHYKDQYYPSSFVIVSKDRKGISTSTFNNYSPTFPAWISDIDYNTTYQGGITASLITGITTSPIIYSSDSFKQVSYCRRDITTDKGVLPTTTQRPNKLVASEDVYRLQNSNYTKSTKRYPLSSIKGNYLFVYNGDDFEVDEVIMDYIKQPRRISLRFNQSCELAEQTHEEICMIAVEYLQKSIVGNSYQITEQDNKTR